MSEWRSIAAVGADERIRLVSLARYDGVEVRAQRMFGHDYDPEALAAAKKAFDEKTMAWRAEQDKRLSEDSSYVVSIGAPLAPEKKPWLDDVPLSSGFEENAALPASLLPTLCDVAWRTGRFELVEPSDNRRRWLMEGLEVREIHAALEPASQAPSKPRSAETVSPAKPVQSKQNHRPRGSGLASKDAPLADEINAAVQAGRFPSRTKAAWVIVKEGRAESNGGRAESVVSRLVNAARKRSETERNGE